MPASCLKKIKIGRWWALSVALLVGTIYRPLPAVAAGPRDEVIASMYRCAVVGETRTWLDCFYGAAQPLRAALNLATVPAAQAHLAQNPPAGTPSDLDLRYQVTVDVIGCNALEQDREWLDCYYASAQSIRARLGLPPAPQTRPQSLSQPRPLPATQVPVRFPIVSRIVSLQLDEHGFFTAELANGQTWRQMPGDTSLVHLQKPPSSYAVQISRGALHSFNLKIQGISVEYKVERIQ
jgi:hypothetical protein